MEFLRKILVILFFIVLTASCTRKVDPGRIHIPVPTKIKTNSSQQKAGALASGVAVLEFAVLNIRGGGAPTFVRRMEVDTDDGITEDDILTFTIEDPPEGNDKLIQFMGVYEDESSGSLVFYYGDQNININGGEINLNLPANVFGGSTGKEGHVSGRMLSSQGPDTGPTGKLTLSFQPPDGKPAMEVIDFEIWDGWFSIFAIDSPTTGFTYTLKETGEVLFDSVNLNSSHFNPASGSTHHAKFNKPQSFQSDDGSLEAVTEADAAVGFFAKPGASGISFSGYNVCYHTDQVSIARSFTNSAGTSPLQWKPSGGTVGTDITASEGVAQTFETFATQSSCDPTSGTAIPVYPQKMDRGDSRAFGMDGPFRELNPFGSFGQYANLSYDGSSLTMSWSYLPGVLSNSAVSGAEIYAKFQTGGGGGGGGGDDTDCREQALEEGFTLVGTSTTENFVFNGSGHPAGPVTSGNRFNWRLQACPFRNTSVGKVYADAVTRATGVPSNVAGTVESARRSRSPANMINTTVKPMEAPMP